MVNVLFMEVSDYPELLVFREIDERLATLVRGYYNSPQVYHIYQ